MHGTGDALNSNTVAGPAPRVEPPVDEARRPDAHPASGRTADLVLLGSALVIGAFLRVWQLGAVGLNSDEAVYAGQAASLAGNESYLSNFPIVRAHPLLFHLLVSPFYSSGTPDMPGRYVSAAFGVATIALVFVLGRMLFGRRTGALAALLIAVMPYAVVVSRQVLLDGPMTFFTTAAAICLAMFARTERGRWVLAAGACLGLAALAKETAVVMVMAAFTFLALEPRLLRQWRPVLGAAALALGLTLVYPAVTALAGGGSRGQSYLAWQLSRQPNHELTFYVTVVLVSIGLLVVASAVVGLVVLRHRWTWRETLLVSWVVVPFVFFELWPTKGFPYLVVGVPALVILAARPLAVLLEQRSHGSGRAFVAGIALASITVLSLLVPAVSGIVSPQTTGLAGAGGSPGGREAGEWVRDNLPADSRIMTIGPSMANVLQYYSGLRSDGLSVSPNPLRRNPSYTPILNPDNAMRTGVYRYVVWDAYSAARSSNFEDRLLALVRRYDGRVVHTQTAMLDGTQQPVVVVYEIPPPKTAEQVPPPPAVLVPNRTVIYVAYALALLGGLAVVLWAWRGRRATEPAAVAEVEEDAP